MPWTEIDFPQDVQHAQDVVLPRSKDAHDPARPLRFFAGHRVLVTGASGFIGWHVASRLVEAGARVRALVRPGRHAK